MSVSRTNSGSLSGGFQVMPNTGIETPVIREARSLNRTTIGPDRSMLVSARRSRFFRRHRTRSDANSFVLIYGAEPTLPR